MNAIKRIIEIARHPSIGAPAMEWVNELNHLSDDALAELETMQKRIAELEKELAEIKAAQNR